MTDAHNDRNSWRMIPASFTDQLGRTVSMQWPPQRIVSLVPSQTELLHDLGLGDRVVGITKFCVHPLHWFRGKARVGGTKDVRIGKVRALRPDLIIANKEENVQEQIAELAGEYPVWVSDVNDLPSALEMIGAIAAVTDTQERGNEMMRQIAQGFAMLAPPQRRTVVYLIWKDPYMAAGTDTFISDMLAHCGLDNAIAAARYPELDIAQLVELNPEVVLLSSEPYPFRQHHVHALQRLLPKARIMLVDGELFSWYGSRLLQTPAYLHQLHQLLNG
jgi:ABC-type Fe3+-hydroxamate transport system substrate-binding protein